MSDFIDADIIISHYADDWGPFLFNIPACTSSTANDGIIPYGTTINDCTVKAHSGIIREGHALSEYPEVTTDIIDQTRVPQVQSNAIAVFFQHPGSNFTPCKCTLIFECDLSSGAKQAFFFNSVVIK